MVKRSFLGGGRDDTTSQGRRRGTDGRGTPDLNSPTRAAVDHQQAAAAAAAAAAASAAAVTAAAAAAAAAAVVACFCKNVVETV